MLRQHGGYVTLAPWQILFSSDPQALTRSARAHVKRDRTCCPFTVGEEVERAQATEARMSGAPFWPQIEWEIARWQVERFCLEKLHMSLRC